MTDNLPAQPAAAAALEPPLRTRGPSPEKTALTRQQILTAARAELLEYGFASATMARVAHRAGLAKGTAYRYFPSKEALFLGLMQDLVTDPLRAARENPPHEHETMAAYCRRVLLPLMEVFEQSGRAAIAQSVLTESRSFPELTVAYARDVFRPFQAHLRALAARAVAQGELEANLAEHVPQLLTAPIWMGMIQNAILDPDHPVQIGAVYARQIDLIFGKPPIVQKL